MKDVKPEDVRKFTSFANDSKEKTGINLDEALKAKLNERLPSHPMANNKKPKKFKEDLRECKDLIASLKPTQAATPNNNARGRPANQQ